MLEVILKNASFPAGNDAHAASRGLLAENRAASAQSVFKMTSSHKESLGSPTGL